MSAKIDFSILFRYSHLPMWIIDADTLQVLDVNDSALKNYRYTRDKFLELTATDIRVGATESELKDWISTIPQSGEFVEFGVFAHLRSDNTIVLVHIHANRLSKKHVLVTARNVTDEIEQEQIFRNATSMARVGSWKLDLNTNRIFWSQTTRELHEVAEDFEPDLTSGINFYHPDYRELVRAHVEKSINENVPFEFEAIIVTAKGNETWVKSIGKPVFVNGRCESIYGSFQDISTLKKTEHALKLSNQVNIDILESIGDAFFAVDNDWTITYWNRKAEEFLSVKREELIGKNLWDMYGDAVELEFYKQYHMAKEKNQRVSFREFYPPVQKWFAVTAYPSESGLTVYFQDVTDVVEAENDLQELNASLERHVKDLQRSNAELEQFAYVTSHDLQEPLRMVVSFLNLLERKYSKDLDEIARTYISFASGGAKRMKQIISDLLNYSRIGNVVEEAELVDLNEVVKDFILLHKKRIDEKNARISYTALPVIHAPRISIQQILFNLLDNALKYHASDKTPTISINAQQAKNFWRIEVKDNGIGIEPEHFDKIFTLFQRLHSREKYDGVGMGLSIVKKPVENLDGKIWVESERGNGTVFIFEIPQKFVNKK